MGVKVVDFKGDGNAWIVVHDQRLSRGRLRKYVGRDWKAAKLAASHIRVKLAANDLSFVNGDRPQAEPLTLQQGVETYLRERTAFGTMDEATRRNYERLLVRHVYPTLGVKPVTSIRRDDLVRLFEGLLSGSADPGGRKRGKPRRCAVRTRRCRSLTRAKSGRPAVERDDVEVPRVPCARPGGSIIDAVGHRQGPRWGRLQRLPTPVVSNGW